MTASTIADDVSNWKHLAVVLEWATDGEEVVPIERLRRLACGDAAGSSIEEYGDTWTETLVDLLLRGGVGQLERHADGAIVLRFADDPLPTAEEAWQRASYLSDGVNDPE